MTHSMIATRPTSTLHLIRPGPPALPAGLTELDAARITRVIAAGKSEPPAASRPRSGGKGALVCPGGTPPRCPPTPPGLAAYLTERAEDGKAISTLDMSCTVIRHVHQAGYSVQAGRRGPLRRERVVDGASATRGGYAPRCWEAASLVCPTAALVAGVTSASAFQARPVHRAPASHDALVHTFDNVSRRVQLAIRVHNARLR